MIRVPERIYESRAREAASQHGWHVHRNRDGVTWWSGTGVRVFLDWRQVWAAMAARLYKGRR